MQASVTYSNHCFCVEPLTCNEQSWRKPELFD